MKKQLLDVLVSLALGQMFAAPQGGGKAEEKSLVNIPEKVNSWHEQGKKEGKRVHDAIEKGEMLAREVLLVYAEHLATEHDADGNLPAAATDFLTGYASAWTNPNTAKARKTEAKAVFDAFAQRDEEREVVVGMTVPEKGSKENPTPIKETQTVGEWLLQHQNVKGKEGYRGLIDFAKELRGPASGRGAGGGSNRGPRAVTTKQQGEIEARIEVMKPGQAHSVAVRATAQLAKLPGFELALFRQIMNSCEIIANKSTDEACKRKADLIWNHASEMVEKLKAAEKAITTGTTITGDKPAGAVAPAPAPMAEAGKGSDAPAPATEQKTGTNG